MKIIKECTLDCVRFNSFKTQIAKQNDSNSRFIKVTLADDGEPLTVDDENLVLFNVKRSDSKVKIFEGGVDNGKLIIPIPNWALEKEGIIECDVSVLKSDTQEKLSSTRFHMMVEGCVADSDEISKDENYDFLFQLMTKADNAVNSCETATKKATDIYNEVEQKLNSGELKGEKGESFKYSDFTAEQLENLRGPQGESGAKGPKGDSYILTDSDKSEIAQKIKLPTKTSDLENDSNFINDENYIHTDNNYTEEEKTKLDSLANYDDTELKKQISDKQDRLTAGENIVIDNSVISSTCVIKPLALSTNKSSPTMLTDIGAGAFITTNTGYIKTNGGFQKAIGKGAELIIVSTLKDNIAQLCVTVQTGSSVLFFWDKMSADMTNEIFISTLSVKNDLDSLNDRNVMSGTLAKTMFDERIKKSEVGDGLKYENGKLSLDIPVATASTTYGGDV